MKDILTAGVFMVIAFVAFFAISPNPLAILVFFYLSATVGVFFERSRR